MKKYFYVTIGVIFFSGAVFLISGFYYSNQLIHPPKDFSRDLFKEWGVKGESPKSYGLDYEDVVLKTKDGLSLKGWYIKSKPGFSDRAVILTHGYGASKIKMLKYVPFLWRSGYNILLFDLRAHGESEGKVCSFGYYEQNDIEAAVNFLYNKKGIYKIGIIGESLGGVIGILAMEKDKRIKAGVFDSTFSSARSELLYYGHKYRHLPSILINFAILLTEKRLKYNIDCINILKIVGNISPAAVFFIHAENDPMVKVENTKLLYQNANYPKYIWLTEDRGHTQSIIKYKKEYQEKVLFFLKSWL